MSYTEKVNAHARATGQPHVTSRRVESSDGHSGHSAQTAARQMDEKYSMPPVHTEHVHAHTAEHFHDAEGGHNEPEGHGVLGDLEAPRGAMDSPVPERDRQMPDKSLKSKAEGVAHAMDRHGQCDEFEGVMTR